ncbi:hypothetical protein ABT301_19330 [Streptomyces sp. NPDC000987]
MSTRTLALQPSAGVVPPWAAVAVLVLVMTAVLVARTYRRGDRYRR